MVVPTQSQRQALGALEWVARVEGGDGAADGNEALGPVLGYLEATADGDLAGDAAVAAAKAFKALADLSRNAETRQRLTAAGLAATASRHLARTVDGLAAQTEAGEQRAEHVFLLVQQLRCVCNLSADNSAARAQILAAGGVAAVARALASVDEVQRQPLPVGQAAFAAALNVALDCAECAAALVAAGALGAHVAALARADPDDRAALAVCPVAAMALDTLCDAGAAVGQLEAHPAYPQTMLAGLARAARWLAEEQQRQPPPVDGDARQTLRGVRRTLLWTLCEAMEKSAVVRGHLCAPDSLLLLLDVLEHTAATAQTDQDDADQDADQDEHGDDVSAAAPQPPNRPMPQSAGHRQADAVTQMIVGVSGEDAALERLFGSGAVRERLLGILGRDADGAAPAVAAAAALCLGNLARTDAHCEQLVGGHGALVARLVRVWFAARGGADVHVRHAVSGLLKNLCLPAANKQPLADMGLAAAAAANITTAVVPIQANAIGILRHLATGAPAAGTVAQLLRPLADDGAESALQALLRTVRTTDIDGIRCEGTRLVAAVAKKIYLRRAAPAAPADGALLDGARHALEAAALDLVTPLVRLVLLDGQRHPLLQQESLVALTVLAAAGSGVDYAGQITALLDPARSAPLAVPPAAGGDDDEEEPTPAGPARGLAAALRGLLAPEGSVWPQSTLQAKSLVAQLLASSAGAGADAAAGLAILRDELAPLAA